MKETVSVKEERIITVNIYDQVGNAVFTVSSTTDARDICQIISRERDIMSSETKFFKLVLIVSSLSASKKDVHCLRTLKPEETLYDIQQRIIAKVTSKYGDLDESKSNNAVKWYFKDIRTSPIDLGAWSDISGEYSSDEDEAEELSNGDMSYLANISNQSGYLLKQSKSDVNLWRRMYCVLSEQLWCVKDSREGPRLAKRVAYNGMVRYREGYSDQQQLIVITASDGKSHFFRAFSVTEQQKWIVDLSQALNLRAAADSDRATQLENPLQLSVCGTRLHCAAERGDLRSVCDILAEGKVDLHSKSLQGYTALHCASTSVWIHGVQQVHQTEGRRQIVLTLVAAGADVNATDNFGVTALHLAAGDKNIEILKFLLSHGANLHARTVTATSVSVCLYSASGQQMRDIYYLNAGSTALHVAVCAGHYEVINLLLAAGADPRVRDDFGRALLDIDWHPFSDNSQYKEKTTMSISLLISCGCELTGIDPSQLTRLMCHESWFRECILTRMGFACDVQGQISSLSPVNTGGVLDESLCRFLLVKDSDGVSVANRLLERYPQLATIKDDVLHMFLQRKPIDTIRIHLCGPGGAGKSTMRLNLLKKFAGVEELGHKSYAASRTQGVEIDRNVVLADGSIPGFRNTLNAQIFDHGGQQEFHVTYSNILSHPMSVFVVVLPVVYTPPVDCAGHVFHTRSTPDTVAQQLRHWLCMLASLVHPESARVCVVLNVFGVCEPGFAAAHVNACKTLLQSCEKESTILHGKFVTADVIVLSCKSRTDWQSKLFPVLLSACKDLQRSAPTIPSVCKAAFQLLDSLGGTSAQKIVPVATVHEAFRAHKVLGKLSVGLINTILVYAEQAGNVLIMNDTLDASSVPEATTTVSAVPLLVILDPNWFCSQVIGALFNYEHSAATNEMKKTASSLKQWFRQQLSTGVIDESVVSLLPNLLCRLRLCLMLPGGDEFWMTTFMEHRHFARHQLQLLSLPASAKSDAAADHPSELQVRPLWNSLRDRIVTEHPTTYQCSGRLVSLQNVLESTSADTVMTDSWQSFVPGSFARFQMKVSDIFWRFPEELDAHCGLEPFWIDVSLAGDTHVFAQMMYDEHGMQTACRIWAMSSSLDSMRSLLNHLRAPDYDITIDRSDNSNVMDELLGLFVSWFLEACQMGGSGPQLHLFCIHPTAAGAGASSEFPSHASTLSTSTARNLFYYPLDKARAAVAAGEKLRDATIEQTAKLKNVRVWLLGRNCPSLNSLAPLSGAESEADSALAASNSADSLPTDTGELNVSNATHVNVVAPIKSTRTEDPDSTIILSPGDDSGGGVSATIDGAEIGLSLEAVVLNVGSSVEALEESVATNSVGSDAPASDTSTTERDATVEPSSVESPSSNQNDSTFPTAVTTPEQPTSPFVTLEQLHECLSDVRNGVNSLKMMTSMQLRDEVSAPRVFVLVPAPATVGRFFRKLGRPARFLMNKYYLFCVCPVTRRVCSTNHGNGYSLEMPYEWLVTYGPAIRHALCCCRLLAGVAASQFHLPNPLKHFEKEIHAALDGTALTDFIQEIDSVLGDALTHADSAEAVQVTQRFPATGASYRALKELLRKLDPGLLHSGCDPVVFDDPQGLHTGCEWVSPEGKVEFESAGTKALFWNKNPTSVATI